MPSPRRGEARGPSSFAAAAISAYQSGGPVFSTAPRDVSASGGGSGGGGAGPGDGRVEREYRELVQRYGEKCEQLRAAHAARASFELRLSQFEASGASEVMRQRLAAAEAAAAAADAEVREERRRGEAREAELLALLAAKDREISALTYQGPARARQPPPPPQQQQPGEEGQQAEAGHAPAASPQRLGGSRAGMAALVEAAAEDGGGTARSEPPSPASDTSGVATSRSAASAASGGSASASEAGSSSSPEATGASPRARERRVAVPASAVDGAEPTRAMLGKDVMWESPGRRAGDEKPLPAQSPADGVRSRGGAVRGAGVERWADRAGAGAAGRRVPSLPISRSAAGGGVESSDLFLERLARAESQPATPTG